MPLRVISFGFKYNPDIGLGTVIDARVLANPFHCAELADLRGDHPKVAEYIRNNTENLEQTYQSFLERAKLSKGIVFVGCTGGKHRSVYITERLAKDLNIPVEHLNYSTP